jgi:hydrogenase nickel incorporation protein HypA/HybF
MHELSIAMRLIELVEEQLAGEPQAKVTAVDIRVGVLSSVVPQALEFVWGPATRDSQLQGAELRIERQAGTDALELVAIELSGELPGELSGELSGELPGGEL